jgi:hypothetical protein
LLEVIIGPALMTNTDQHISAKHPEAVARPLSAYVPYEAIKRELLRLIRGGGSGVALASSLHGSGSPFNDSWGHNHGYIALGS